jgi:probable addiction module antidote protein/putative addiction module killer protein
LRDSRARAKILLRIERLEFGNPGDVASVGDGFSELRIHYGPGYRVYYVQRGAILIILLCGGDKSTQAADISAAETAGPRTGGLSMARTTAFDAADYLDSPEMVAAFLTEAFESDDPVLITKAIGTVARAKGMTGVAEEAGLSRENLYRALGGDAKPEFATVLKVLHALGISLVAQTRAA